MELTHEQKSAVDDVRRWVDRPNGRRAYRVFGPAGTGKTMLARHLAEGYRVAFGAYTGKAASRMRRAGCNGATTVHQLIYETVTTDDGPLFRRKDSEAIRACEMVVIDECSMVGKTMGEDLLSYDKPVLVLGDPAQLAPIDNDGNGAGYFTSGRPDFELRQVHRQAEASAILRLATFVREGGDIRTLCGKGTDDCKVKLHATAEDILEADQVLVGFNAFRREINAWVREKKGFEGQYPLPGDRVVSLRNDHAIGVLNGETWDVLESEYLPDVDRLDVLLQADYDPGRTARVEAHAAPFRGEEVPDFERTDAMSLDFAYALTVHKAQGSEWDRVLVFDQSDFFEKKRRGDGRRWRYTAITRAAEQLLVAWPLPR